MKRILIIKMWAFGDILMATPLLRALKRDDPDCRVCWFVDSRYEEALKGNPLVDEVFAFDSKAWLREFRSGRLCSYWKMSSRMRRDLLSRKFDVTINLTAEKWWSIWWAGLAPTRIGVFPRTRPGLIGGLYSTAIPRGSEPRLHNTRHYLRAAEALGIPEPYDERIVVGIEQTDREAVDAFVAGLSQRPLAILHPGTSQELKCWPIRHFARLAAHMDAEGMNVVITGSPAERPVADVIAAAADGVPLVAAGALQTMGQTAALVARAAVVVTGDTSILHIAAAVDCPVVGIYGSTRPGDNAPLTGRNVLLFNDEVACAPCYIAGCWKRGDERLLCLLSISPEQVLAVAKGIMKRENEPTAR